MASLVFVAWPRHGGHSPTTYKLWNLRTVTIAINNYAARNNGQLPQDIVDANGRKLWSWRVLILPDMEGQLLYDKLRLKEPWDSEYNRQYTSQPIPILLDPRAKPPHDRTSFLAPIGEGTVFGDQPGVKNIDDIPDGLDQTVWLVEVDDSAMIPWAKPGDFEFDPADPSRGMNDNQEKCFIVGFADTGTMRIDEQTDPETLLALFRANDGKKLDREELEPQPNLTWERLPEIIIGGLMGLGVLLIYVSLTFPRRSTPTTPSH
jgi:hypothetical protein